MSDRLRVLIVEDSEDDELLVLRELRKGGYDPAHERVDRPDAMREALGAGEWDVVLSDYAMPGFGALAAIGILKKSGKDIPFIIVSGSIGEETAVEAMKAGADDYVMKDRLARLVPAIRRELREARVRRAHAKAVDKLREQARLLDLSPDAILVLDDRGRIAYWNRGAERLYGWPVGEALGKDYCELVCAEPCPDRDKIAETLADTEEWRGECVQAARGGRRIVVDSVQSGTGRAGARPSATLVINTDITAKKQLEARLLRSQRLESIGTIASGVAHDLNNILAPITLAVEMLKTSCVDQESRKYLPVLETSAERGANLIKQVLSFVRGTEEERKPVRLGELISEIEMILKGTFPKTVSVYSDADDDLRPVLGDGTRLIQVLMNLCVNARDAMPEGGALRIRARNVALDDEAAGAMPDARPGLYTAVSVSDTGTGIPPGIADRIFEPYFTTKETGKGTGMGLSTVRSIVREHGGFVTMASVPGEGATFEFCLPSLAAEAEEMPAREEAAPAAGGGETILVVDDEVSIREIMREILESCGYRVITAANGAEAIMAYRENIREVKAVLLDLMMPVMDGPRTVEALRALGYRPDVILVTGMGAAATFDADLPEVRAVLPKPFTMKKLLETVREVLAPPL